MKVFINGKYVSILKADHKILLPILKDSGVNVQDIFQTVPNIGTVNIDGFSIRTILKSSPKRENYSNSNIFLKTEFDKNINFKYAFNKHLGNSSDELNRVRTIHRLIFKTIPIKKRKLKQKILNLDKESIGSILKLKKIKYMLNENKIYTKELKQEFSIRKKIALHVTKILIPSIYIIRRKNNGAIQAKWTFLGTEQKRIHLGMAKKIKGYKEKKLRNMAIEVIRNNYGSPLNQLTYTWIDRENRRLKKWQNTIKMNRKIYL